MRRQITVRVVTRNERKVQQNVKQIVEDWVRHKFWSAYKKEEEEEETRVFARRRYSCNIYANTTCLCNYTTIIDVVCANFARAFIIICVRAGLKLCVSRFATDRDMDAHTCGFWMHTQRAHPLQFVEWLLARVCTHTHSRKNTRVPTTIINSRQNVPTPNACHRVSSTYAPVVGYCTIPATYMYIVVCYVYALELARRRAAYSTVYYA